MDLCVCDAMKDREMKTMAKKNTYENVTGFRKLFYNPHLDGMMCAWVCAGWLCVCVCDIFFRLLLLLVRRTTLVANEKSLL